MRLCSGRNTGIKEVRKEVRVYWRCARPGGWREWFNAKKLEFTPHLGESAEESKRSEK
jgi:hypothetical protein